MSAPRSSSAKSFTVHIPRNALKIAGIAFGVGVLLFVLVWLTGRDKEFFRADPAAQTPQETAQVEPPGTVGRCGRFQRHARCQAGPGRGRSAEAGRNRPATARPDR